MCVPPSPPVIVCAQWCVDGCVLCVCVCRFQVFVKGLDGKTITLDLKKEGRTELNTMFLRFNIILCEVVRVPPDMQRLVFAGKELPAHNEFSYFEDIGITDGSTVHLSSYMQGGMDAGAG